VDQTYGEAYRELYTKHWWWRSRTEFILKTLRELPGSGTRNEILDIGCGDGLFFDRLAEFGNVEGVEPSPELVSKDNPHRDRIHICPFDANFQPDKRYSLVLMLDVLEHLPNPVAALRHALDLLHPDGQAIITVPAFMSLWTSHDVLNHHYTRYTKSRFRIVAEQAGFRICAERYFFHWTCPIKLAARCVESILPSKPKPPGIPATFVNSALFWLSLAEQETLTRLPMPFGSSLMIVGGDAI
jgi:2-polyprenyl-3-methyl-5-hydroxy-6-metoxy-1,4-benzoquinol methylase